MVKKLILIRHAEPETPAPEKYCIGGRTDWPLSEEGIRQCRILSAKLMPRIRMERQEGRRVEIWSSPMKRAIQTASFLCETEEDPKINAGFREMDAGDWDGKPFRQIREEYPDVYKAREKSSGMYAIPGAEQDEDGLDRFRDALRQVFGTTEADTVIVVAHGTVIRLFMNHLSGESGAVSEKLPYTGIAEPDITAVRAMLS